MKFFDRPTQVRFWEAGETNYGIAFENKIICACCGSVIDPENYEAGELVIEKEYNDWIDFSVEIGEDKES